MPPPSIDDFYTAPRWVFIKNKGPVHPRSQIACMLRAGDRRHGTTNALASISYGPVELGLRKMLALLNWRRWWR